jgi:hypothetical protein
MKNRRTKRLLPLLAVILFGSIPEAGWADPDFWLGVQGLFYRPDNAITYGSQRFNRFWGLGGELGWIPRRQFQFGIEMNYAYASPKGERYFTNGTSERREVVLPAAMVKAAYRFKLRSSPYLGLGFGNLMTFIYHFYSYQTSEPDMSSRAEAVWKPFLGYDYRRSRHLGFRLEGQYQPKDKLYIKGFGLIGEAYLAW